MVSYADTTPPLPFPKEGPLDPYVNYLKNHLIRLNRFESLEAAIQQGLEEDIDELKKWEITSANNFLYYANYLLTSWVPSEVQDGRFIYKVLTVFYYIFDRPAIADLQTPIQITSIEGVMPVMLPLSDWIVGYAKRMGSWLSTPESLTAKSYETFTTADNYNMGNPRLDYHIPDPKSSTGGFKSFNEFFCRYLKDDKVRPIDKDPSKIVFPADSTFDGCWPIDENLNVLLPTSDNQKLDINSPNPDSHHVDVKSISWPLPALLAGSAHAERFKKGAWAHVFLNTYDYHRQHAPVAGTIVEAFLIEGCAYLQVVKKDSESGGKTLVPHRGCRKSAEPDAPDAAGYQFIQQRGCIIIDTGDENVGMVAVLPMGMAQVSSVKLEEKCKPGEYVEKGGPISWFEFGGSDLVLVFEEKAGVGGFPPLTDPKPHHLMGEALCTLHYDKK